MDPSARRMLVLSLAVFLAALAQMDFAYAIRIHGAQPDFILLTVILASMFCGANRAAALGFWGGILTASIVAPPHSGFGGLIVSRTLIGFGIGWLEERIFRDNPLLACAFAALGSALAEALFFLFAPQHNIAHWARALLMTTLYNTLLSLPLYFLVRRIAQVNHDKASN